MIRTVFGSNKSGTALIPIFDTIYMSLNISTRLGNAVIDKGDGSSLVNYTPPKLKDFTNGAIIGFSYDFNYGSVFTGDIKIKFLKGLKDVYSMYLGRITGDTNKTKINITDIELFFKQYPNLYSLYVSDYAYGDVNKQEILKGDFAKLPNSVEKLTIEETDFKNASTDLVLNFSSYTNASNLKYLNVVNAVATSLKVTGDIAKFPTNGVFLYLGKVKAGSSLSYTGGKIWASSFDTLYLPIRLTIAETDNLFIDANNSVTTAIGGKSWTLQGVRTIVSDTAVSGLISKGFAVNCKKLASTLILDDPTNLLNDNYARYIELVGNPYDSDLFKTSTGNYGYMPNSTDLDFGTGSLRFGCTVKFSSASGGIIGKTIAGSAVGRYGIYLDSGKVVAIVQLSGGTYSNTSSIAYNDGNFHTIEVICNRATGKQTLTIDGVLINTTSFTPSSDNLTRNAIFWIGGYGNSTGTGLNPSSEFNGIIKDVFVNKF